MQAWKEEVQFIEDTPIRIILDDEISVLRGKLLPHWHEALEIDLVLKGEMVYIIDGVSYEVGEDDIVIIDSNVIHSGRFQEGSASNQNRAEVMTLQINKAVFQYAHYKIPAFQVFLPRAENAVLRAVMMEMRTIFRQKREYYELLLNAQALKVCYSLLTAYSVGEEKNKTSAHGSAEIKLAIQYVEEQCTRKLALEEVAAFTHYNPSYFSRRFHQYTGFTFNEYLNRCRVKKAEVLLLESKKTVSEVAFECGFSNVSSFLTYFKRLHHQTPEKYRKDYTPSE